MTEVLSQDEIDQLLTAINSGDAETEDTRQVAERKNIRIWDFRRPDKFSKEQIRTVSFMHETFARLTTTSLAAQLRSMVHVHVASVDQLTYEEFLRSIPSPTALAVINMGSPHRIGHSRDRSGDHLHYYRPSVRRPRRGSPNQPGTVGDRTGGYGEHHRSHPRQYARSLESGDRSESTAGTDRNQSPVRSNRAPTEMVVLVTLETKVEEAEGMLNFCIPYLTIEPIISKLSAQYWYSSVRHGATTENLNVLRERLAGIDVPLVAEVGNITLSMKDVMALQPGNVIRLSGARVGDPMIMKLGNRPKFECRPGVVGQKLAVQVTRKIEDIEEDEFEEFVTEGDEE